MAGQLRCAGEAAPCRAVAWGAARLDVATALLRLGKVQFPITGPRRYTMTAEDAVELCGLLRPHTAIPVHYEGWSHFHEDRAAASRGRRRAAARSDSAPGCAP